MRRAEKIIRADRAGMSSPFSPCSGATRTVRPLSARKAISSMLRTVISSATSARSMTERLGSIPRRVAMSPFCRSRSTRQVAPAGSGRLHRQRDGQDARADAALGAGDRRQPSALTAAEERLAGQVAADRTAPVGGRLDAVAHLLDGQRQAEQGPRAGLHGHGVRLRPRLRDQQDHAERRTGESDLAQQLQRRHRTEALVQDQDVGLGRVDRVEQVAAVLADLGELQVERLAHDGAELLHHSGIGTRKDDAHAHGRSPLVSGVPEKEPSKTRSESGTVLLSPPPRSASRSSLAKLSA